MAKSLTSIGKFLDQPLLSSHMHKNMPAIIIGGGSLYGLYDTYQYAQTEKNKNEFGKGFLKRIIVIGVTAATALASTRGIRYKGKTILPGIMHNRIPYPTEMKTLLSTKVDDTIKQLSAEEQKDTILLAILNKFKSKPLSPGEMNTLVEKLQNKTLDKTLLTQIKTKNQGHHHHHTHSHTHQKFKKALDYLIPPPHFHSGKDILHEAKNLSLLGLFPVLGGLLGGFIGNKVAYGKTDRQETGNMIKEGFYQYLANIVLCNVGAAGGLMVIESMNMKSNTARVISMVIGILAVGILGGSAIANFFGKTVISPLLNKHNPKQQHDHSLKHLNDERHPEVLDALLHVDDFATVGVFSGIKIVEPFLPFLYSISAYRAGVGYRNGEEYKHSHHQH